MENDVLENPLYHNRVCIVNKLMFSVGQTIKYIKDYDHKGIKNRCYGKYY